MGFMCIVIDILYFYHNYNIYLKLVVKPDLKYIKFL
nr:MAG TPA: hypothetical protein [Caudoviricetes sp.]